CAFSHSLTTTVFSQCRSGRFDASPRRATPKGHNLHLPRSSASIEVSYLHPNLSFCARGTHTMRVLAAFGSRPSPASKAVSRASAASAWLRDQHITTRRVGEPGQHPIGVVPCPVQPV